MNLLRLLVRKPSGEYSYEKDGSLADEGQTLSCCHCGHTWHVKPGSGTERGWCYHCHLPTCGNKLCDECKPYEEQVRQLEQRYALWRQMEG